MIGLRIIFLKHKLMRTFCRLTHEEDGSSISNNRSTNHFASSRISWKFLRTVLLTNVQRVALRRGWLVRFVEKETQKRGDVGDRRRTRGNTRRIRFFSVPSVSYTREANVFGPDSLRSLTRSFFRSRFRFQCLFHRDFTTSTIRSLMGEASRADERRTEAWPTGNFRIATIRGERAFSRGNLCYIIIDAISLRLTRLVVDPIPR